MSQPTMSASKKNVFSSLNVSRIMNPLIVMGLILCLSATSSAAKMKEANAENCEVCVKFLGRFIESLSSDEKSNPKTVEKQFLKACKAAKKSDNRFCYYVGGTEDSATSIINEVTKPISWGMPAEKVCLKLQGKDSQICDLKYEKSIDYVNMDLKKMRVKELKKVLADWDDTCRGCTEKSDYVRRIEELLPKYAPDAAAARAAKTEL